MCIRDSVLPVSDVQPSAETVGTRQRQSNSVVQTGRSQLEARIQRSRQHGHEIRHV